jgi:hypothetical protein
MDYIIRNPAEICQADSNLIAENHYIVAIYGPMIYTAPYVYLRNAFDAGKFITRASGRRLGPGN